MLYITVLVLNLCFLSENDNMVTSKFVSQEVVVYSRGRIRSFVRELDSNDNQWLPWVEYQPYKPNSSVRIFKEQQVDQKEVVKAIGPAALRYIHRKTDRGILSGYYNFSGNNNYDWKEFGGDNFGTWLQRETVRIEQPK
jgi:hypothetical protein